MLKVPAAEPRYKVVKNLIVCIPIELEYGVGMSPQHIIICGHIDKISVYGTKTYEQYQEDKQKGCFV